MTPQVAVGQPPPVARGQELGDERAIEQLLRAAGKQPARDRGFVAVVSDTIPGTDMSGVTKGRVVGYVGVEQAESGDDVLVLDPIVVDPGERHKGVGTYLIQFAVEVLSDSHAASTLITSADEPYLRTFGFRPAESGGMVLELRG